LRNSDCGACAAAHNALGRGLIELRDTAMERHIDPYRGARILVITGAVMVPLLLLLAGWAYFAMT
jgi:hypothetical protein